MSVVTTAMITKVANKPSEMMPRCRPMLMIINSIMPRAFINTPMPKASRFDIPDVRAANQHATHFPEMATSMTNPHMAHRNPESNNPMRVLSPEYVKNNGTNSATVSG